MASRRKIYDLTEKTFPKVTFNYGMELEMALRLILGDKADHSAGGNLIPSFTRAYFLQVTKKLRDRVDNIVTMDERLRGMLFRSLRELETEIRPIRKNVDWQIIATILLGIVGRLLGYDGVDGKVHREVIFFRTREQEAADYRKRTGGGHWNEADELLRERYRIVLNLKKRGFTHAQIAQIVGTTEYAVKQVISNELLARICELRREGLSPDKISQRLGQSLGNILSAEYALHVLSRKSRKELLGEI